MMTLDSGLPFLGHPVPVYGSITAVVVGWGGVVVLN